MEDICGWVYFTKIPGFSMQLHYRRTRSQVVLLWYIFCIFCGIIFAKIFRTTFLQNICERLILRFIFCYVKSSFIRKWFRKQKKTLFQKQHNIPERKNRFLLQQVSFLFCVTRTVHLSMDLSYAYSKIHKTGWFYDLIPP